MNVPFLVNFLLLFGSSLAESKSQACEMLIAIDEPLYDQYYHRNLETLTKAVKQYVVDLNNIYKK